MKRLIQWLLYPARRSGRAAKAVPPLPAAVAVAPDWLPRHQTAWKHFLESETGQVLWARYRAIHGQVAIEACKDQFHTSHAAGTANGWHECGQWLLSLSRSSRVIEEPTDSLPPGEAELAERFSP